MCSKIPRNLPILTYGFDNNNPIGRVDEILRTEEGLVINYSMNEQRLDIVKKYLKCEIGGRIIERKDGEIVKFDLHEVALITN